ncbi:hypothetical protein HK104_007559, partial [Borealophlyctis nickersoniae]
MMLDTFPENENVNVNVPLTKEYSDIFGVHSTSCSMVDEPLPSYEWSVTDVGGRSGSGGGGGGVGDEGRKRWGGLGGYHHRVEGESGVLSGGGRCPPAGGEPSTGGTAAFDLELAQHQQATAGGDWWAACLKDDDAEMGDEVLHYAEHDGTGTDADLTGLSGGSTHHTHTHGHTPDRYHNPFDVDPFHTQTVSTYPTTTDPTLLDPLPVITAGWMMWPAHLFERDVGVQLGWEDLGTG